MSDEPAATPGPAPVPPAEAGGGEPGLPAGPPPEPTGDPRVDEAVARLGELAGRPVAEHVEIFEDVHQRLQDLLAGAERASAQGPSVQAGPAVPPPRPAFPDALRPRA
ncbi:hypothetical protein F8568_007725 [Actinomadura sp. LD22]|uniref:Uncharacterized protein n=1 Tax=Actinomadura physcomitrii TaxID=2650748 RepID=A0A6I4M4B9_9ACTN|nr:hypothetical protein [Actinomadura physcomitrii]MWA00262.1 hypothetical protein [Actinomadura physcomitrii]